MSLTKVRKRDGSLEAFDSGRISAAIQKAFKAINEPDEGISERLSDKVVSVLQENYHGRIPSVEDIQDLVEQTLIQNNFAKVAKVYILYRDKRQEYRDYKKFMGVSDDLKLDLNVLKVLQRRYLRRDANGKVMEPLGSSSEELQDD